jgi:hypothetical protein
MKQNAEIFATQDYYEFVRFDRVRRSAPKYDELRSTWRNRRVRFVGPHIGLRFIRTLRAALRPSAGAGVTSARRAVQRRSTAMIVTESV